MNYLHASADALGSLFTVAGLVGLFIGIAWGFLISFMPGVGGNVAIALLLPFIFRLPVPEALALLLGTHIATYFGGSITSITMNIPASAKSVSLCWDGFPLSRKGKGAYALGASATASSLGGVVGAIVLTIGIPVMKRLLNVIGSPEIFMLAVWGVVIIAIFSSGDLIKGVMAGGLGILMSWVGESPITGLDRLTFGSSYLSLGIQFATAAMGLFAVAQALRMLSEQRQQWASRKPGEKRTPVGNDSVPQDSTTWSGAAAVIKRWRLSLYMSLFGVFTGTIPGLGAPVAAIAAYGQAAQLSKNKSEFGHGAVEGVIAPQATDAAAEGGGMLPMLTLGIPTHEQQAILLSAFVVLGVAPGPTMLTEHLNVVFTVIWIIVLASLIVGVIGLLAGRTFARLSALPPNLLIPLIVVISMVGSYAVNGRIGDSMTAIVFGLIGYVCFKYNYSRVNLIIGLALGPVLESHLHIATQLYGTDFVVRRPVAAGLAVVVLLTVGWWIWKRKTQRISGEEGALAGSQAMHPGWGAVATAVAFVAVFAVAAYVGSTYGPLTGRILMLVALFCLVLSIANAAGVVRAQLRSRRPIAATEAALVPATAAVGASYSAGRGASSSAVVVGPGHDSARPAGAGGHDGRPPADQPAAAVGSAGPDAQAGLSPQRTSLIAVTMQRRRSREVSAEKIKGFEFTSALVIMAFLAAVLVFGMTPGVGIAMAVYRYVTAPSRSWRAVVGAVLWGFATSAATWVLFDTLVNQFIPFRGWLHTG